VNDTFCRYAGVNAIRDLDDIREFQSELYSLISHMRAGQDQVVRLETGGGLVPLNVHMTEFIQDEKTFYLVSVQNIRQALDTQEVESYQKLIRVLTHEIMNSVSPINSLSESLYGMVSRTDVVEGELRANVEKGLHAIQVRSKGLETFTEAYKQLTRIPKPHYEEIDVTGWMERVVRLTGVDVQLDVEEDIKIHGDERLLEQVLINLVRNAQDAVSTMPSPEIQLSARRKGSFTELVVSDNGSGIPADKLDKIFIPFFTTKKEGSGIGLALSRQIIKMHGGSIEVESRSGEGTSVKITL
jgi:signal transduction histidine kinase